MRSQSEGWYNTVADQVKGSRKLGDAIRELFRVFKIAAPEVWYYGTHILRIWGLNELFNMGFSRGWIMNRMDLTSDTIFRVYFDARIAKCQTATFFLAHLPVDGDWALRDSC